MKKQKLGTEKVRWDLSVLYFGIDDPQIDIDVKEIVSRQKAFNKKYKGNLAKKLGGAMRELCEINMLENKLIFLYLAKSLKVEDAKIKAKAAEVHLALSRASGEYMTFFDIELVAIDDDTLNKLYANDKFLAKHKPWIDHARVFKPHLLTEEVEGALTKRRSFGSGAWSEFFDELEADLEFEYKGKKTLEEVVSILSQSKNSKERGAILKLINSGLSGQFAKYAAQTLYMIAGSSGVEVRERSYRHPMESRNKSNRIPGEVVDSLHRAVINIAAPLAQRYYRLKARHLGVKRLKWSDRNAPLPFTDTTVIQFKDGLKMVLEAYESFSPTLAGIIREGVKAKRIDAPVIKGKQGGAYNYSFVLPGGKPAAFLFLNYLGSSRDVMTLAHELGHHVHGILAGQSQGPLMFAAPTAYAETASTFGEMTTFNFLIKRLRNKGDKKALLALIMGKIDDTINTVVRQIGFSNFERQLHGMNTAYKHWQEPRKLSVQELSSLWLRTLEELYGADGKVFTYKDCEYLWSYISHFHRSFYVYSYACGDLLTQSLYAQRERLGSKFEPLYLELLRAGSTKGIIELTKPFGLNPASDSFWIEAINIGLGEMIKEAEIISREI